VNSWNKFLNKINVAEVQAYVDECLPFGKRIVENITSSGFTSILTSDETCVKELFDNDILHQVHTSL